MKRKDCHEQKTPTKIRTSKRCKMKFTIDQQTDSLCVRMECNSDTSTSGYHANLSIPTSTVWNLLCKILNDINTLTKKLKDYGPGHPFEQQTIMKLTTVALPFHEIRRHVKLIDMDNFYMLDISYFK